MIRSMLLLLMLPITLRAQSTADVAVPAVFTATGTFFAVSVADLETSTRWYAEKLGLRVVREMPKVGKSSVTVLAGGGLIVELVHNDNVSPRRADTAITRGIFKAGVIVDSIDRTIAAFRARQVEIAYGPFPARSGAMANVIIRDNEGNLIQFFGR